MDGTTLVSRPGFSPLGGTMVRDRIGPARARDLEEGTSGREPENEEISTFVVHTHPVAASMRGELTYDLKKADEHVEGVID